MWPTLLFAALNPLAEPLARAEAAPRPTSYPVPAPSPSVHAPRVRPATVPQKTLARRERIRRRNLLLVARGGLEPLNDATFAAAMRVGQADIRARRGWQVTGMVTGYEKLPRLY